LDRVSGKVRRRELRAKRVNPRGAKVLQFLQAHGILVVGDLARNLAHGTAHGAMRNRSRQWETAACDVPVPGNSRGHMAGAADIRIPSPHAFVAPEPIGPLTLDWGRTAYTDAWRRQEALVAQRLAGEVGDTLVFTEHDPVYTLGVRPGAESHLVWTKADIAKRGIALVETNRGGDITYHGPGQIVGYPIVDLKPHQDLHAYLRFLEQVLINSLGSIGLAAARRPGKTGIWLGSRKIAAIGVAVKRWVTFHGFALNVDNDLGPFAGIVPCGITDGAVTSLAQELGRAFDPAEVKQVLAAEFWTEFRAFLAEGKNKGNAHGDASS
jgi:lipoyl(octanoyl) transferase